MKDKSRQTVDFLDFASPTLCTVWLLRGAGTYEDEHGHCTPLTAGDVFQRWPGRRHSTRIVGGSGWYEIYLNLGNGLPQQLDALGVLDARRTVWHLGLDRRRIERWVRFRDDLATAPDHALPDLCLRAQTLLVEAQRSEASGDAVAAACTLLGDDGARAEDLRDFCAQRGLDLDAFRKRFQRATGLSPGQYRLRRRLERACALLRATPAPIAAIAADLGYANANDFTAQFRRHLGVAPRTYRAQCG